MRVRRSLLRLRPASVPAVWEIDHPPSVVESYCTTSIEDLAASFRTGRLRRVEYVDYVASRRCLFRGTKGALPLRAYDPLSAVDKSKVLGYLPADFKQEWKELREKAKQQDKMFDEFVSLKQKFLLGKATPLEVERYRELLRMFESPLESVIFEVKICSAGNDQATFRPEITKLTESGSFHWGWAKCEHVLDPETNLPHPFHRHIQLAGSSGACALSVAAGLSQFALGTNAGGSNRIAAGLLGCSGLVLGALSTKSVIGPITRTPYDMALVCAALVGLSTANMRVTLAEPLSRGKQLTIGSMSTFINRTSSWEVAYPGLEGISPASPHPAVESWWKGVVEHLTPYFNLINCDNKIQDISVPFLSRWMSTNREGGQPSAAVNYSLSPLDSKKLILDASTIWTNANRSDVVAAANNEVEACKIPDGIDILMTPLLAIPYWNSASCPSPTLPLPQISTPLGPVLDPRFNPYCILANAWKTPSISVPVNIKAPHPNRSNETCDLPFAILLTATKATKGDLIQLLNLAHKIHQSLTRFAPPPLVLDGAWSQQRSEAEGDLMIDSLLASDSRVTWPSDIRDFGSNGI